MDSQDQSFFSISKESYDQFVNNSFLEDSDIPEFLFAERPKSPARSVNSKSRS